MLAPLLLCASLGAAPPPPQEPDPERDARARARTYESLLRRRAPMGRARGAGVRCDERVARFCLQFGDEGDRAIAEPEPSTVVAARRRAVEAYRRWLAESPGEDAAAGPLIRLLIEEGRPREAAAVARTHLAMAPGVQSRLWLGLALHVAGETVAAEAAFDRARAAAGPEERRALDDVGVLLDDAEFDWYRGLDPATREAYHRRFWAFSDPSLLRPGNERRAEHYARHAWIHILRDAPPTAGAPSWGSDKAQILLRFGVPYRYERVPEPPFRLHPELRVVTYHDPRAIPVAPEALHTRGIDALPPPGDPSVLDRDTVRSTYAPLGSRRVRSLTGQVTRFPTPDGWTLRVDALLSPDSIPATAEWASPSPRVLLTVLDSLGAPLAQSVGTWRPGSGGSGVVWAECGLPAGSYVYQIEAVDDTAGLLALGRFRVERPGAVPRLSDPLLAVPDMGAGGPVRSRTELIPYPAAVLEVGSSLRVYVEAAGLLRSGGVARYSVEWALEPAERPSVLARALEWLAGRIGGGAHGAAAVRWDGVWDSDGPAPVTFELDLAEAAPGIYRLRVTLLDRVSGREARSYRAVRLVAPGAVGWNGGNHS